MSKTIYISDLDGTLLDPNAEISEYAEKTLNRLISQGVNFTIATARTGASAFKILKNVGFRMPIALMNGVLVYDMTQSAYIKKEAIETPAARSIIAIFRRHGISGFMYGLVKGEVATYYENLDEPRLEQFYRERTERYNKTFTQVPDFAQSLDGEIIYFTLRDTRLRLMPVYLDIQAVGGVDCVLYHDNYDASSWYLEMFSSNASKYNAAKFIREYCGADKMVGFGDNLNDLPLFEACDECYAVANAKDEVKARADGVIGGNYEDGVVRWLDTAFGQEDNKSTV